MLGTKVAGVLVLIILAMGGLGYWYYQDTQSTIATLNKNNAKLEISLELSEEAITTLKSDIASSNQEINTLNTTLANTRSQNNELADRLEKHNLGILAQRKPGLVERVVNNASEKAGRCFELLSGAELTEQEKNAKTGNQFNSECPWIFDSSNSAES
jgi:uncharacterized protein HemX